MLLLILSYTGFHRLMTKEKYFNISLVFGHIFEIFGWTVPLTMVQQFNNKPVTTVQDGIQQFVDWYRNYFNV